MKRDNKGNWTLTDDEMKELAEYLCDAVTFYDENNYTAVKPAYAMLKQIDFWLADNKPIQGAML